MRLEPAIPEAVLARVRAPFEAAGGARVMTAVAEPLGLYLDLAGEALRERLFLVQGPERAEYCLRPDFTLGVALAHISAGSAAGRYCYEGPAFRVAPPGSGRAEQFIQIGLEAYGAGDAAEEDAATILLAWRAASAGGRSDLGLVLGDVSLFAAFLAAIGVAGPVAARLQAVFSQPWRLAKALEPAAPRVEAPLARLLRSLDERAATAALEEIWALAGVRPVGGRSPAEIVHRLAGRTGGGEEGALSAGQRALIESYLAIADEPRAALAAIAKLADGVQLANSLRGWETRLKALAEIAPERMRFSAAFARGFGYYDGFLFEVRSAALSEAAPLAAGGRYDSLPTRLGAVGSAGAVGCMVRPGRAWSGGGA